jgi:hypothetical protein
MFTMTSITRLVTAALALSSAPLIASSAVLVFQNGRTVPLNAVDVAQDKVVIKAAAEGFNPGQAFPLTAVSHVFGERPPELNQAIALLLVEKPQDAIAKLEPVAATHRVSAKIAGNFWTESARALLVAYALMGDAARATQIGKDISDATPAQGSDPFVSLGKALLMPSSASFEDRDMALKDMTTDNLPADVAAYATFFRAKLLKEQKKNPEALQAYLSVPGLYPAGGLIINAAAEIHAASLLEMLNRRDEAGVLVKSALLVCQGTILAEQANKLLESLK